MQYVDPLGTLLGDLPTFREVFCGADDRQLAPGQEDELRSRLRSVLQRTLRRQAQVFLEKPFVGRQARLFEYAMSAGRRSRSTTTSRTISWSRASSRSQGSHRQLLLLSFHRLHGLVDARARGEPARGGKRLRRHARTQRRTVRRTRTTEPLLADLEEDDDGPTIRLEHDEERTAPSPRAIKAELARVEGFIERARALGAEDSKFRALLQALRFVLRAAPSGSGKLVIFTESRVTQDYLRERLLEAGSSRDARSRSSPAPTRARARRRRSPAGSRKCRPRRRAAAVNRDIAMRLALVHEFRTRTRVFISTEAGAKGLNLQFCDTVVNYDLPWNPQRIEQRIGRCHRYGQQHDVTVINFLAKDNVTQALTFEILSQKLELFGTVLDASDQVLHRPRRPRGEVLVSVLGGEFESELRRIYDRARTLDEVTAELRALRDKVAEERKRFEEAHAAPPTSSRSASMVGIQRVFRRIKQRVPGALAELDRDLSRSSRASSMPADIAL